MNYLCYYWSTWQIFLSDKLGKTEEQGAVNSRVLFANMEGALPSNQKTGKAFGAFVPVNKPAHHDHTGQLD